MKTVFPVKYFLVQHLKISNREALSLITSKRILVNKEVAHPNDKVNETDVITLDGEIIKDGKEYIYLLFYKPRGIETTLNPDIPDNLCNQFNFPDRIFPVGRLDKESEGLLLLTNDGFIFGDIIHSDKNQEKEYIVAVNKDLTDEAIYALKNGIVIMGQKTKPALVTQLNNRTLKITLTQGLNRQIRRMCYKLGLEVTSLVRIRIINLLLNDLQPGEWRFATEEEITILKGKLR